MKPKRITVTLTQAEADNLLYAARDSFDRELRGLHVFDNKRERNAAFRGHDKIQSALHPDPVLGYAPN